MTTTADLHLEIRRWAIEKLQGQRANARGTEREIVERFQDCHDAGIPPPEELIALLARLHVGRTRNEPRTKIQQLFAAFALAKKPDVSDRKLAEACEVSRSTLARWKKQTGFENLIGFFRLAEALKEMFPWQQEPSQLCSPLQRAVRNEAGREWLAQHERTSPQKKF